MKRTNDQKTPQTRGPAAKPLTEPICLEIQLSSATASCPDSDLGRTVLADNACRDLALRIGTVIMILLRFFRGYPEERAALLVEVGEYLDAIRFALRDPQKAFDPAPVGATVIVKKSKQKTEREK